MLSKPKKKKGLLLLFNKLCLCICMCGHTHRHEPKKEEEADFLNLVECSDIFSSPILHKQKEDLFCV